MSSFWCDKLYRTRTPLVETNLDWRRTARSKHPVSAEGQRESIFPTLPPTRSCGEDNQSPDRIILYEELDLRMLFRDDLNPQIQHTDIRYKTMIRADR